MASGASGSVMPRLPLRPARDETLARGLEAVAAARIGEGAGAVLRVREGERQQPLIGRQLAGERDVAAFGAVIIPGHGAVLGEILPPVRDADKAGAGAREAAIRHEAERSGVLPRRQVGGRVGVIAVTAIAEMRRRHDVELGILSDELERDQDRIPHRVGHDPQRELVSRAAMADLRQRNIGSGERDLIVGDALDLVPARGRGHDEIRDRAAAVSRSTASRPR